MRPGKIIPVHLKDLGGELASARSGREEGSVLGGLGRLLDGDNS